MVPSYCTHGVRVYLPSPTVALAMLSRTMVAYESTIASCQAFKICRCQSPARRREMFKHAGKLGFETGLGTKRRGATVASHRVLPRCGGPDVWPSEARPLFGLFLEETRRCCFTVPQIRRGRVSADVAGAARLIGGATRPCRPPSATRRLLSPYVIRNPSDLLQCLYIGACYKHSTLKRSAKIERYRENSYFQSEAGLHRRGCSAC